ncbi:ribonuclease HII [Flaviflexus equikiangi]|uniref:ribonuclease HII n=1 Tax=Flaviflexus equikiangi TaxID=2758573 RepID=UPI0029350EE3|nr:ribonuclease HII [Flaviflexus equikiangi]
MTRFATRELEQRLLAELDESLGRPACLVGMDEVGRGSLAGPVAVGAVLIASDSPPPPTGLADSKVLSVKSRDELVHPIREWAPGAVGYGSVETINTRGIVPALREAGMNALAELPRQPDLVLLDGVHDWLTDADLFSSAATPPVRTVVKGDLTCTVIAAASILAKVARDSLMSRLDGGEGYSWSSNKGYASPSHIEALTLLGPHHHHRTAWKLPGVAHE